jgi:hypothetical protein
MFWSTWMALRKGCQMQFMTNKTTAHDIAARYPLRRYGNVWRGECPCCRYDRSCLSIIEANGHLHIECHAGCDFRDVRRRLLGDGPSAQNDQHPHAIRRSRENIQRKQERALKLWLRSTSTLNTVAHHYLTNRGLGQLAASPSLRFLPSTTHPYTPGLFPALIAQIIDSEGQPTGIQKTFLAPNGMKASVDPVRQIIGSYRGGAIRLGAPNPCYPLVVAEGLESTASAALLIAWKLGLRVPLPAWSAISCGNLAAGIVLPDHIRRVLIGRDLDAADPRRPGRFPGQDAARDAASRWHAEGREVRYIDPPGLQYGSGDFSDSLLLLLEAGHVV